VNKIIVWYNWSILTTVRCVHCGEWCPCWHFYIPVKFGRIHVVKTTCHATPTLLNHTHTHTHTYSHTDIDITITINKQRQRGARHFIAEEREREREREEGRTVSGFRVPGSWVPDCVSWVSGFFLVGNSGHLA